MTKNCGINIDNYSMAEIFKALPNVDFPAVQDSVVNFCNSRAQAKDVEIASLLRAVTCLDLTTLCGDDTKGNVQRLCFKAESPIRPDLLKHLGVNPQDIHVGAVCVYPNRVSDCVSALRDIDSRIPVAAVAAGFPSGQYHLGSRLQEIKDAIEDGAKEIDIVINRDLALCGEWEKVYREVSCMKKVCEGKATLKAIIAAGELASLTNVYKASFICMLAGTDFIKTSTGKESINATLPIGIVMTRAIRDYYEMTGYKVGFKPAGGIRNVKDALSWQMLMRKQLGKEWLFPDLFRFGSSSLLGDIENHIFEYVYGAHGVNHAFPFL